MSLVGHKHGQGAWRTLVASHYVAVASCSRSCEEDIDDNRTSAGMASLEDTSDTPGSGLVGIVEVDSNVVASWSWAVALEIDLS